MAAREDGGEGSNVNVQTMNTMNVVIDGRLVQDHFPGIGRYVYNLSLELPAHLRDGERIAALYDPSTKNTHYDLQALADRGVRLVEYRVPIFSPRNIVERGARSVVSHESRVTHYTYYVRPYLTREPSVTTIYDAISFVYPQFAPSARARLSIRVLHEFAIRASRMILTISDSAANDLMRQFPSARSKIAVTHLAPDPIFTRQPTSEIACEHARMLARFNLSKPFSLYLASNKPHKNLVRLMEAWRLVMGYGLWDDGRSKSSHNLLPILVIAGHQDPRYPQAQEKARTLGVADNVRFIAEVSNEEAAALYSACELFVFPSLYEGFGLTVIEAMACGAPVACSNTSSLPEVVGDAALAFDPLNPDEIAAACIRILSDPSLQSILRERSLRQAAKFTWAETARLTIDVYRRTFERLNV